MAINVTSLGLGVSYLDPAEFPALIKQLENYVSQPYDDGKHIATIGIGIALQNQNRSAVLTGNLALVLRKIGVFAASDAGAPVNETTAQKNLRYQTIVNQFAQILQDPANSLAIQNGLSNLRSALDAAVAQFLPTRTSPQFSLSELEAKEVKSEYILGYTIGPFSDSGAQDKLDLKLNGLLAPAGQPVPHDTREYMALMSLWSIWGQTTISFPSRLEQDLL